MLRIETQNGSMATSFTVEGKLIGPWVSELERCWRTARFAEPAKSIIVNLVAVAFIDSQGRDLLMRMRQQGTALVPSGCLMKSIVEEIEKTIKQS